MKKYLSKSLWLALFSVVFTCLFYPLALWVVGQIFFPFEANGSMLKGPDGTLVGSKLIAQPFTKDEYFHPRPSAASYDATASASSSLAASNYALRDRVARSIGPVVTYKNVPNAGQSVGPDIESWFKQDKYQGQSHIVDQWATLHNSLAQAWAKADPACGAYIDNWAKAHPDVVAQFVKDNPTITQPKSDDLAVVFFQSFSEENPGKFPDAVSQTGKDGKTETVIEPTGEGADIQSIFFDMWRQDHPDVVLNDVPGDMVTASGSGLDPHITLANAEFQLERVASSWAASLKRDPTEVRHEIDQILKDNASAPLGGLAGEKIVNVLEVNLKLHERYHG